MFPAATWSRLQARLWRSASHEQLTYATGPGHAGLREAVADYLQGTRGVVCTPEQVVITSGTQQSLHLVAQLLADPGDAVWLEDPGYWGARSVFRVAGLALQPVPVDGEGMAPHARAAAAAAAADVRLALASVPDRVALMSHGRRRPAARLRGGARRRGWSRTTTTASSATARVRCRRCRAWTSMAA